MNKILVSDHGTRWWYCPGCSRTHPLPEGWTFNGDLESPTFSPSFKHTWKGGAVVCHYIVTDGRAAFCADSTHALAGRTVLMPDAPASIFTGDDSDG